MKRNNPWGVLLVCVGLLSLLIYWGFSRTLLRYRFDAGWRTALLWCLGCALGGAGCAVLSKYFRRPQLTVSNAPKQSVWAETPSDKPRWGRLRWWEIVALVWLWLPFVALAIIYYPPLRQRLIVRDHHYTQGPSYDGGYHGGWGFALPEHFYDPTLGPLLLRDEAVIANRMARTDSFFSLAADDWTLFYASRRLQGRTDAEIWREPHGREMFLGTLKSEAWPPEWWEKMGWLREELHLQPSGTFQLGLLSPSDARTHLGELAASFTNIDAAELRSEVIYSLWRHPALLTQTQADTLLSNLAQVTRTNEQGNLTPVLVARQQIRELARRAAHEEMVGTRFNFPDYFPEQVRATTRETMRQFLATCGLTMNDGNDLTITVTAESKPYAVVVTDTERKTRPVTKTRTRYVKSGKYGSRAVTETYTDTEVYSDAKGSLETAEVPMLVFRFTTGTASQVFALPPFSSVERTNLTTVNEILKAPEKLAQADDDTRKTFIEFLRADALRAWRFGY